MIIDAIDKIAFDLRKEFPNGFITRFAPSPTGYLHLGHISSLVIISEISKRSGGKVFLRIEDHDQSRSRPHYIEAIAQDLSRCGFSFTEGPSGQSYVLQSDRFNYYKECVLDLHARGLVYACNCSRKSILQRGQPSDAKELHYDGFCRNKGIPIENAFTDKSLAIRFRASNKVFRPRNVDHFIDKGSLIYEQNPHEQCGDFVILDKDNNYSYQFAVVCDDIKDNVDVVIRGQDILTSTGRQIDLHSVLSKQKLRPIYYHHPLVLDADGKKMSKRFFSESIRQRLDSGESSESLIRLVKEQIGYSL